MAIRELRERMALAPDLAPSPPLRRERGAALGIAIRLGGLVALAALAAYAFVWISAPHPQTADVLPVVQSMSDPPDASVLERGRVGSAVVSFPVASFPVAQAGAEPGMSRESGRELPDGTQRLPSGANPLSARRGEAPSAASPTSGTAVAVGVGRAERAAAPTASEPSPSAARAPNGPDRDAVATLITRGQTYVANGDIVSARIVFRRAAEAGNAQAALALGGTYDPLVLKSLGVIGVGADAAQARGWYRKAAELGSLEASQRIDQLAQSSR